MKNTITIILLLLIAIPVAVAKTTAELEKDYLNQGQIIIDMVNARSVNSSEVEDLVTKLTQISVVLSQQYMKKFPEGKKLLELAIKEVAAMNGNTVSGLGPMVRLPFKQIEDEWHDLGFVESNDVGIDMEDEDNEHFTDPLHVMVHPIMVLRAARDYDKSRSATDLNAMKSEMEEGMEQVILLINKLGR